MAFWRLNFWIKIRLGAGAGVIGKTWISDHSSSDHDYDDYLPLSSISYNKTTKAHHDSMKDIVIGIS